MPGEMAGDWLAWMVEAKWYSMLAKRAVMVVQGEEEMWACVNDVSSEMRSTGAARCL